MDQDEQTTVRHAYAHLIGRVLIASFYLAAALGLIVDPNSLAAVFKNSILPDYFRWPDLWIQLAAALAILVGYQTRTAALLLAIHIFWSSFIVNYVNGDFDTISAFWKDLAMIGGLIMVYSHGGGMFALDNRLERIARQKAANADAVDVDDAPDIAEPLGDAEPQQS
jgi:putative oxidoreductase